MLKVEALQASYGQSQVLFDVGIRGQSRRDGDAARAQRHGQDHDHPRHHGHDAAARRHGHFRGQVAARAVLVPHRQARPRLSAGRSLHLRKPDGVGKSHRHRGTSGPLGRQRWTTQAILQLFPWIAERRHQMGGQLSGGEQQMLAIGRALMTNPELLILDEATEGLAPIIRQEIWKVLQKLKASGQSILIVDKNLKSSLPARRPPLRSGARARALERRLPARLARNTRRSAASSECSKRCRFRAAAPSPAEGFLRGLDLPSPKVVSLPIKTRQRAIEGVKACDVSL